MFWIILLFLVHLLTYDPSGSYDIQLLAYSPDGRLLVHNTQAGMVVITPIGRGTWRTEWRWGSSPYSWRGQGLLMRTGPGRFSEKLVHTRPSYDDRSDPIIFQYQWHLAPDSSLIEPTLYSIYRLVK